MRNDVIRIINGHTYFITTRILTRIFARRESERRLKLTVKLFSDVENHT